MVTIIDDAWLFSVYPREPSERDLRWMSAGCGGPFAEVSGVSPYLLQADFAVRRHEAGHRDRHRGALAWFSLGERGAKIDAMKKRFRLIASGLTAFTLATIYDLTGALALHHQGYPLWLPDCKNFGFQRGSRHWKEWFQHREADLGPKRLAADRDDRQPDETRTLCCIKGGPDSSARGQATGKGSGLSSHPRCGLSASVSAEISTAMLGPDRRRSASTKHVYSATCAQHLHTLDPSCQI
jgi:hypothetical protein